MKTHIVNPARIGGLLMLAILPTGCMQIFQTPDSESDASGPGQFALVAYEGELKNVVETYLTANFTEVTGVENGAAVGSPSGIRLVCGNVRANGAARVYLLEVDADGTVIAGSVAQTEEQAQQFRQICSDNNIAVVG